MNTFHPKSILVPIDFSETSLAGLQAAKILGKKWRSELCLVHVNDSSPALLFENIHTRFERERLALYSNELNARLGGLVRDYPHASVDVFDGDAREAIGKLSRKGGVDLVAMGTHGYHGWRHWVLGSVAESILPVSAVPLLTVHSRPKLDWPMQILVPMKFTDYADQALDFALNFARSLGAGITLLHVVEDFSSVWAAEALDRHLEQLLGEETFRRTPRMRLYGNPAERIVAQARHGRFDLVILSAHRRSPWKRWKSKMTAERVLRDSEVPVLSVPFQERPLNADDLFLRRIQARPRPL